MGENDFAIDTSRPYPEGVSDEKVEAVWQYVDNTLARQPSAPRLVEAEGWRVTIKRVYRIWREQQPDDVQVQPLPNQRGSVDSPKAHL